MSRSLSSSARLLSDPVPPDYVFAKWAAVDLGGTVRTWARNLVSLYNQP